jgi:SPP1 gp7 family putative phage head morphogenesis protein
VNASTQILHALLDNGVFLHDWSSDELKKLLPILEAANERVLGKIAATNGEWTKQWLIEMKGELDDIYGAAAVDIEKRLMPDLKDLAAYEAQHLPDVFGKVLVGVSTSAPSATQLWAAVTKLPVMEGSTIGDLLAALPLDASSKIVSTIQSGMAAGDTTQQLVQRIRGKVVSPEQYVNAKTGKRLVGYTTADLEKMAEKGIAKYKPGVYKGGVMEGATTRSAEVIARTATMHVGNQAREAFYEKNTDIIKGYQRVETLDLHTCPICGAMDGAEYGPDDPRPELPEHPECRGVYTPILKSFEDIGIDAADLPPSTRASMDGQVPEFETYSDWLSKASGARRIEALGPSRAALYQQGVGLDQMVKDGKLVPLKDLNAPKDMAKGAA